MRRAYDTVAEAYASMIRDTTSESALDLAMVEAFAAAVGTGRVLDAGCGAGRLSRHLADRGCAVTGIDLSARMIAIARRDHPSLAFAVGSLQELPYRDASFDGALLWYSTIHTERSRQPGIYREVHRVLKPGGVLLVGFQTGKGERDLAPVYRNHGFDVELVRHRFSPNEVGGWIEGAGLEETARLVRRSQASERDGQAVIMAQR